MEASSRSSLDLGFVGWGKGKRGLQSSGRI
jgi:hypothetical protein